MELHSGNYLISKRSLTVDYIDLILNIPSYNKDSWGSCCIQRCWRGTGRTAPSGQICSTGQHLEDTISFQLLTLRSFVIQMSLPKAAVG